MGCFQSKEDDQIITQPPKTEAKRKETHPQSYASLPYGAEKHSVARIIDGDTIKISDGRNVRFLGIDTPEIKAKEPYALEAKKYVEERCNSQVWLAYESEKQDGYGRLLAHVYVRNSGNYLCLNEALVAEGLAGTYFYGNKPLKNKQLLLKLQSQAIANRKGKWSSFKDYEVYKTRNGAAFHRRNCKHVKDSNLMKCSALEALKLGLHPCRECLAGS